MSKKTHIQPHILKISPYVPGKPVSEVQRELGLSDVLKMASNENIFGPSAKAVEAMNRCAGEMNLYPDGGCYFLKEALAKKHGVSADNIIVGNGTDEVIRLLCTAILGPDEELLVAHPSFVMYTISAMLMDASLTKVALKDYTHDLPSMNKQINERTRMVIICNPNNPTGTIVRRSEVEAFLDTVPENVLVVFDEAYFEYVQDADYPDSLDYFKAGRNVACLRTFSKVYGLAGLRVGYGIVSPDVRDALDRVRNPFNVNQMAQEAALAALGDDDHLKRAIEFNNAGRKQLEEGFNKRGLHFAQTEANFILVDTGRDSHQVFESLLRKGVIVRPGKFLGFPTHIRVTIADEAGNARFLVALDEVLKS